VHWVTIGRWRRNGWRANTGAEHPLDIAGAKLEAIAPLATGEPALAAEANDLTAAKQVSDAALLRQEAARLSAVSVQVWNATEPKLEKLVRRRTGTYFNGFPLVAPSSENEAKTS
jgi:hypothetical protein